MNLHPHAQSASTAHLRERIADGTIAELAALHVATSRIRSRLMDAAAGNEDNQRPDEPDLSDLADPFVFLASVATALQHDLAAHLETAKAIEALRVEIASTRAHMRVLLRASIRETEARKRRDAWVLAGTVLCGVLLLLWGSQ